MAVFGPPGSNDLDRAVALTDGKVEAIDAVAALDLVEESRWLGAEARGAIEVSADVGEESSGGHTPSHSFRFLVLRPGRLCVTEANTACKSLRWLLDSCW